jgi:hypothetical protein
MTPKGADLEATDLIEVSTIESGSYVTRSITGQELIDAIPPTTIEWGDIGGTLSDQTDLNTALNGKQDDITLTTTGSGAATFISNVLNIPTPPAPTFTSLTTTGSSGSSTLVAGVLNVPTYTLAGLGGVPTTRTLTINGVTQDLSADRTFTISTDLTVGTTPISSGTNGRVLFQGTGNVLQQSSSLFWDDAALRFQVGSSSTSPFGSPLIFMGKDQNAETNFQISNSTSGTAATVGFRVFGANNRSTFLGEFSQGHTGITEFASHYVIEPNAGGVKHGLILSLPETTAGSDFMIYTQGRSSSNKKLTFFNATGNLLLQSGGTHTDAGFRLDVNGTARVQNEFRVRRTNATAILDEFTTNSATSCLWLTSTKTTSSFSIAGEGTNTLINAPSGYVGFFQGLTERARFASATGNLLINTTTDAGFRLDVNGTAIVRSVLEIQSTNGLRLRSSGAAASITFRPSANLAEIRTNDASILSATFNQSGVVGFSQQVSFGGTDISNASAQVEVNSTTKGFLPPRMTTTQKNAIASPATGLQVFDTTLNQMSYYNGTTWTNI